MDIGASRHSETDAGRPRRGERLVARRWRRATLALAVTAGSVVGVVGVDAERAFAEDGLRYEAHSTYTVDPAAGVVHVVVDATITNQKPNRSTSTGYTQYYFPRIGIPILAGATNLAATRDGRPQSLGVETTESDRFQVVFVDLSPDLYYRDVAHLRLGYDMPSAPPRSTDGATRVNSAFATFWAFPVADPGLTSVRILIPKSFEVDYVGNDLTEKTQGEYRLYESGAIGDPLTWAVVFSARNDDELEARDADHDERKIRIRSWPDDDAWADFVDRQLDDGLPELEALIGLDWPRDDELQITETYTPYLYGYAGWYTPDDNTIEAGDALDAEVILHEVSHLWFNEDLFSDRWVNEGFAQAYSNRAVDASGGDALHPDDIDASAPGAVALNAWGDPSFRDDTTDDQEEFGYNASFFVIDAIIEEIGDDKMRDVLRAADQQQVGYVGDPKPEKVLGPVTWKRLLDLVERAGGSEEARTLWLDHVVDSNGREAMRDRSRAITVYEELVDAGGEWTPPIAARTAMTKWQFGIARTQMAEARAILETRDEVEDALAGSGVDLPTPFEPDYEGAEVDLAKLRERASGYLDAAEVVAAAHAEADAGPGLLGTIGLWGDDYETRLARADRQFEQGKADAAATTATAVRATLDDASTQGRNRVLMVVGAIAFIVVLVFAIRRLRRKRRARRAAALAAAAEAIADAGASADNTEATAEGDVEGGVEGDPSSEAEAASAPSDPGPSETHGESFLEPPHPT